MHLDRLSILKRAALVVPSSACVRLVPVVITGMSSVQRVPGWGGGTDDTFLITPEGSPERPLMASEVLVAERDLPDEIVALLWPDGEPEPTPKAADSAPPAPSEGAPRLSSDAVCAENAS